MDETSEQGNTEDMTLPKRTEREEIEDLLRRVDAVPTLDLRICEEVLGYDEHGLPR